jgi:hypothetical protein
VTLSNKFNPVQVHGTNPEVVKDVLLTVCNTLSTYNLGEVSEFPFQVKVIKCHFPRVIVELVSMRIDFVVGDVKPITTEMVLSELTINDKALALVEFSRKTSKSPESRRVLSFLSQQEIENPLLMLKGFVA